MTVGDEAIICNTLGHKFYSKIKRETKNYYKIGNSVYSKHDLNSLDLDNKGNPKSKILKPTGELKREIEKTLIAYKLSHNIKFEMLSYKQLVQISKVIEGAI